MRQLLLSILLLPFCLLGNAETNEKKATLPLRELQQQFVDLKFGMFIHFNMGTYMEEDWADPDAPLSLFNPTRLDCNQWAQAAKSAKMRYGCLTTKHHNGFCLWDTKTTDYNAVKAPLHRDVVREYVDAFHKAGLKVFLYYSILDMHHGIRPGCITEADVQMIKTQLTELFTNYGEITAVIIDGWDAPWSRISYDEVPFAEMYRLIKSLQPNCLVMDLNAAKYPTEALFYTDIKSYEQNAGQHISKETNKLPALSCLPINSSWFWKESFPTSPVKSPSLIVDENINPMNRIDCNFILNVSPNREGLIDDNTLTALRQIGKLWDDKAVQVPFLPPYDAPLIARNLSKFQTCYSSWSHDMWIMDFANDDDFTTSWTSNEQVEKPWYVVDLKRTHAFNTIVITDLKNSFDTYTLFYEKAGEWIPIPQQAQKGSVKIHRFDRTWGEKIKIEIVRSSVSPSITEFAVYDEER
ncbi:MAG: alpha-L-fucosidase [Parabacteroides sp.]|nr:alpha-L-fucosidase [Parabacteroides sp.]